MSSPSVGLPELPREELYQLVWSKPVSRLAIELNIKAHRLTRFCDELLIPRPSSRYWALLKMGRSVDREPLPELDATAQAEVDAFRKQFFESLSSPSDPHSQVQPVQPQTTTIVKERPARLHELVQTTRDHLRKKNRGHDGVLAVDKSCCLDMRVTWDSVERALNIFDLLLKHWESLGGTASICRQNNSSSFVTEFELNGDRAPIELFETVRRVTIEKKTAYGWTTREYRYEPTGKLTLHVGGYAENRRSSWSDGKRQRLEDLVDSFTRGIIVIQEFNRARRLDEECVKRQESALAAVRKVAHDREQQQNNWREELLASIKQWREAESIREDLRILQGKLDSGVLRPSDEQGFAEWKKWVLSYVNKIDPFSVNCEEDTACDQPKCLPSSELDLTRACRAVVDQLTVTNTDELYQIPR